MREGGNIINLSSLHPDFMGFIFYEASPRNAIGIDKNIIDSIPKEITPVGVFVDSTIEKIDEISTYYGINLVQLHGDESPEFCNKLRQKGYKIIKAISIPLEADKIFLSKIKEYEDKIDIFLFDTKGSSVGGTGVKFHWDILTHYDSATPFILSGGIQAEDAKGLCDFMPEKCIGVDINSKFELYPGVKNVKLIETFIKRIRYGKKQVNSTIKK